MQFLSFRIQFGLSGQKLKIFDLSILGLATLTFYGFYKLILKRNEILRKLKQFRYLYTIQECQYIQIDKKEILIQGQINNNNQFLLLKSSNCLNNSKNFKNFFLKRVVFFQIADPSTNNKIDGRLKFDCKFENDLINYRKQWKYKTEVSPSKNFIVRQFRKIQNYFFGQTYVENLTGINQNQYFVFKGTLEQQKNKLEFGIDHIAQTPQIFYDQIMKELESNYAKLFLLTLPAIVLITIIYSRVKSIFCKKTQEKLFNNKENEVATDSDLCIICQTTVRNVLILPCFHLICCKECLDKTIERNNQCPLCRSRISQQKELLIDD